MNGTIVLMRAMLIFVLWTQVTHQRISLGDPTLMNWFMAITIELSISVISSAILTIIMGSKNKWRWLALGATPALFWCMSVSYEASVQVFHKNRLDQVNTESKTLAQKLAENRAIGANNKMVSLSNQGITSGTEYDNAIKEMQAGMEQSTGSEDKQESTTAMSLTGGDGSKEAVNEKVLEMAKQRAIMLIVLTLALSGLSGLWTGITAGFRNIDIMRPLGKKSTGAAA